MPFTLSTNLDSSKLKVFSDDSFKSYENGTKLSKTVEKNGEKICPFPTVFSKDLDCRHVWERVKTNGLAVSLPNVTQSIITILNWYRIIRTLTTRSPRSPPSTKSHPNNYKG